MKQLQRALFVSNVVPWPLTAGDKIRAYHLVRAVAEVTEEVVETEEDKIISVTGCWLPIEIKM